MEMKQLPGAVTMYPNFCGLERKCSIRCGGTVGLGDQGDLVIKTELLRVDCSRDDFGFAGPISHLIQLLLFAYDPEVSRDREISILDAIEG